jgi:hypothetical protein
MGAGQFSIFGAIEEKEWTRISRIGTSEKWVGDEAFLCWMAAISYRRSAEEKIW